MFGNEILYKVLDGLKIRASLPTKTGDNWSSLVAVFFQIGYLQAMSKDVDPLKEGILTQP